MRIKLLENIKSDIPFLVILGSIIFLLQVYIVSKLGEISIVFYLGGIFILLLILLNFIYNFKISLIIFIINLFPLIYLNNEFHYSFILELLLSFPIFIWFLLAFFQFIYKSDKLSINLSYLQKPIIFFVLYSFLTTLIGIGNGKPLNVVFMEFLHVFYYLFAIIIYKFFNRKEYIQAFYFMLFMSTIIAIEYIYINLFTSSSRFVTFQSGMLPIVATILFSTILFNVRRNLAFILLIIIVLGTFVTLTRTLWITTFIALGTTLLLYLYFEKQTKFKTIIILVVIMLIPLFFIAKNKTSSSSFSNQNVEDRTQSLAKPTEDHSFLMRAEIGFYVIKKFLHNPIVGSGYGDYVRYKILGDTNANVIYPDSTYLYILWKSGMIGFIIYMSIFWRFLKITFYNFRNSESIITKLISLGLVGAFIGLAFLNILSPLFIKYKSNIIIAFLLAFSDYEYSLTKRYSIE